MNARLSVCQARATELLCLFDLRVCVKRERRTLHAAKLQCIEDLSFGSQCMEDLSYGSECMEDLSFGSQCMEDSSFGHSA